ncbi:putative aldo-keto reductase 1 [Quercus suber]|uniref:Aldo-keto reductase 1 n=1 Tax=Quercus suber TaxID=58331 RepID=A0AAW0JN33_QUESU
MLSYNGRFSKAITFFDTANVYGDNHDNEIMVGKALKQLPREKIQLATKFGVAMSKEAQLLSRIPLSMYGNGVKLVFKYLDVDYIDLYYQHRVDTSMPIKDTMSYSLWTRDIEEDEIIPLCREIGIGIVAYGPLGHGFFGGKAVMESLHNESMLAIHPRFMGENL